MKGRRLVVMVVVSVLLFAGIGFGVDFVDTGFAPSGVKYGSVAWGDYDGDGYMDLAVGGLLYHNNGGVLSTNPIVLADLNNALAAWGDYDGDGDIDLFVSGYVGTSGDGACKIFTNNGGTFSGLTVYPYSSGGTGARWVDWDCDGDLDIVSQRTFRNDSGVIVPSYGEYVDYESAFDISDFNNDGYPDTVTHHAELTSDMGNYLDYPHIYINDGNGGVKYSFNLPYYRYLVGIAAGDFDGDGLVDFAGTSGPITLYKNQGDRSFVESTSSVPPVWGRIACGDLDNDGDLDLIATGSLDDQYTTKGTRIAINSGGVFADSGVVWPGYFSGKLALGDCDNDGDLDFAMSGYRGIYSHDPAVSVMRNSSGVSNTRPSAPSGLIVRTDGVDTIFSWNAGQDGQTPANLLTYNIRIGKSPGGNDIRSGMATSTGMRLVPGPGNTGQLRECRIKNLPSGMKFYWSVQTVDSVGAGSVWSEEQTVTLAKISGKVLNRGGQTVPDITITRSDNGLAIPVKPDGTYEVLVMPGWSGTLTPGRQWTTFKPASISYNDVRTDQTGQNFVVDSGFTKQDYRGWYWGPPTFADMNADGYLDIVEDDISINKAGSYPDPMFPDEYVYNIVADLDNNGLLDVVYCIDDDYDCVSFNRYGTVTGTRLDTGAGDGSIYSQCGDYDNDGKVDLLIAKYRDRCAFMKNNGDRTFTRLTGVLPAAVEASDMSCSVWGDYDNDGDLDLLHAGTTSAIYRNDGGVFRDILAGLPASARVAAWGDYDSDGDLDFAILAPPKLYIYRNNSGVFSKFAEQPFAMQPWDNPAAMVWCDTDNDGDLDLTAIGYSSTDRGAFRIYRNDNNVFTEQGPFPYQGDTVPAFGDYDNDGDLDYTIRNAIYRNDAGKANANPTAPSGLSATALGTSTIFKWNRATDAETPAQGLSYNLRIGKTPGGNEVFSGASLPSGKRMLTGMGNVQMNLSWPIKNLPAGKYYWSVQSVDNGYAGSAWAPEQSFVIAASGNPKRASSDGQVVCRDIEMAVTAVFGDSFYAEDINRMYGIRVDYPGHGRQPGDKVKFSGVLSVDPLTGEAYVAASSVVQTSSLVVRPFFFCNRSLGGGQCGIQQAVSSKVWKKNPETGTRELVFSTAQGMNNIGMLVRITGRVTYADSLGRYFYIDDGSGLRDGSTSTTGAEIIGVRVEGSGRSYTIGQEISVTGISSCFKDGAGRTLRYIRVKQKTTL